MVERQSGLDRKRKRCLGKCDSRGRASGSSAESGSAAVAPSGEKRWKGKASVSERVRTVQKSIR